MSYSVYLALFRGVHQDELRAFWVFADSKGQVEDVLAELRARESIPEYWTSSLLWVPCSIAMGLSGTYKEVSL